MDSDSLNEVAIEIAAVAEAGTRNLYSQLNSSALLLLAIVISWIFISGVVLKRAELSATERRRWRSAVRAVFVLSLIVGLLYVWAPELRTFALSIVAFAVAIVIATKELILCFTGGLYRMATAASKIGDRVQVGTHRGEIVDQTLLAMTLQELSSHDHADTFTGHRVVVPNSVLLSSPVINESDTGGFSLREVAVPVAPHADIEQVEAQLLAVAQAALAPLKPKTEQFWARLNDLVEATAHDVGPTVSVRIEDHDKVSLVVHCFAPSSDWPAIRNKILSDYLSSVPRVLNASS